MNIKEEIWVDIVGYEGLYQISNNGRVKSLERIVVGKDGVSYPVKEKIKTPSIGKRRYPYVDLYIGNQKKKKYIHRLKAIAFIANPENKSDVNHKYGDKTDFGDDSIEWNTRSENIRHAFANGLNVARKNEAHPRAKITMEIARQIRNEYLSEKTSMDKLAVKYKISNHTVYSILHNKTWKE